MDVSELVRPSKSKMILVPFWIMVFIFVFPNIITMKSLISFNLKTEISLLSIILKFIITNGTLIIGSILIHKGIMNLNKISYFMLLIILLLLTPFFFFLTPFSLYGLLCNKTRTEFFPKEDQIPPDKPLQPTAESGG